MSRPKKIKSCILCGSSELKLVETLDAKELDELYYTSFGFHILNELNGIDKIEYVKCNSCSLSFFDTDSAGSGSFYEDLQNHRKSYYKVDRSEFEYATTFIEPHDSVLEIGSGDGAFASKVNCKKYIGLEFNDLAIEKAKKENVLLIKESIENYALETKELFDVVCFFHVLEHVTNVDSFLKSCLKLLKKGGKLIISVPCNDSALTNNVNHVLNLPPHHISRWTVKSLNNLAQLYDLDLVNSKTHSSKDEINKKLYVRSVLINKAISLYFPKNKLLLNSKKVKRITKLASKINHKLKLYRFFNEKKIIGENMTFIFQKK